MQYTQTQPISFTDEIVQQIFGNEAAEDETFDRLQSYYLKGDTHEKVVADLPLRIVVGHKGIGKSAIFKIALNEDLQKSRLAILIKPDDIADLGKTTQDPLQTIRDWKIGLNKIIATKALESLGMMDETELMSSTLNLTGKLLSFLTETFKKKIAENLDILPTQRKIVEKFLRHSKIVIYIDDLDRGWQSRKEDINRISALLIAVRDMSSETPGINFKISLRSDVYYLVRTSDESTDKIESSVIWHKWTNQEILILLIKRIESFFNRNVNLDILKRTKSKHLAHYLNPIFDPRFNSSGRWENIPTYRMLMSLIRQRPRDLVKLCTLAARDAYNKKDSLISTIHFKSIFEEYSQGRMQDTINEYKSELPAIERLLFEMKPSGQQVKQGKWFIYNTNELRSKLSNIIQHGTFTFANGKPAINTELAQFLYKINFITARKIVFSDDGMQEINRKYFEENRYLSSKFVDFGYDWEVHPAFRWVLQPTNVLDLINEIGNYSDD
ncbi:P-loop ATPase, Sll1717 family [Chitinophaga sp. 22536]|uniref:P-loop ATPase, Sll1717 family n=1 Tax=unclassified Chitinophaga TaxID=2619133 RepID=UPI003F85E926